MVGSKETRICLFALFPKLMLLNEYGIPRMHSCFNGGGIQYEGLIPKVQENKFPMVQHIS